VDFLRTFHQVQVKGVVVKDLLVIKLNGIDALVVKEKE
jgi:hypothetical protein